MIASAWSCSSSTAFCPVPETDWYVETTSRSMPTASRIGLSATTICMVEQLGLAMMPLCAVIASGLTSDTTSGTSSCMRQYDELSTTTAPASTKRGAHSALRVPPAEKSATSKPWIDSSLRACTVRWRSPKSMLRPALRSEANGTISSAGNARSRITPRIVEPTAPVAPTTATRMSAHHRPVVAARVLAPDRVGAQPERRVQVAHRARHVLLAHDAGDLDRRGGDHL